MTTEVSPYQEWLARALLAGKLTGLGPGDPLPSEHYVMSIWTGEEEGA